MMASNTGKAVLHNLPHLGYPVIAVCPEVLQYAVVNILEG
jgi:hypothetical protein